MSGTPIFSEAANSTDAVEDRFEIGSTIVAAISER